jgi:hypothetical protein
LPKRDIVVFSLVRSFRRRAGARSHARGAARPLARAIDRDVEIRVDLLDRERLAAELEVDPAALVDAAARAVHVADPDGHAAQPGGEATQGEAEPPVDVVEKRGRQPQIAAADVELHGSMVRQREHDASK